MVEKSAYEAKIMINKKIKIYKSLVFDIEGGLGVDVSERTYMSSNPIHMATSKSKAEEQAALQVQQPPFSEKKAEVSAPQKKGILKKKAPTPQPGVITEDETERIKIAKEAPKIVEEMTYEEYQKAIQK